MRQTLFLAVVAILSLTWSTSAQFAQLADHRIAMLVMDTELSGNRTHFSGDGSQDPEDTVTPTALGHWWAQDFAGAGVTRRGLTSWIAYGTTDEDWMPVWSTQQTEDETIVADSGDGNPAPFNFTPQYHRNVQFQCGDVDTCPVTVIETESEEGMYFTAHSLTVATQTIEWSDSGGVTELAGSFSQDRFDAISLIYTGNAYLEVGRSDN